MNARRWWPLPLLLLLGACSDQGDDPGGGGSPLEPTPTTVSFAEDIQPIFDASCVGCHGAGGNAGLDLRTGQSHANLVGVASTQSALNLVEPGEPASSWLYLKITGQQDVGSAMPPGSPLGTGTTDLMREWIEEGAADD